MGAKGFQKGHIVSDKTRAKISKANDGNFFANCDYCGKEYHTKKSAFLKRKRHFCCRDCYSKYRAEILPKKEQNAYGTGYSQEERSKRKKAREIFNHSLAEDILKDILEEEEHERHIEELVLNAIEEGETE